MGRGGCLNSYPPNVDILPHKKMLRKAIQEYKMWKQQQYKGEEDFGALCVMVGWNVVVGWNILGGCGVRLLLWKALTGRHLYRVNYFLIVNYIIILM